MECNDEAMLVDVFATGVDTRLYIPFYSLTAGSSGDPHMHYAQFT